MKLYMSPTSPYARKVRAVLIEKGIDCEQANAWADPAAGLSGHNPLGKVPALVLDDGTDLFDSVVIVEYLDRAFPGPELIPAEPRARALVRRWEALADGVADATVLAMLERRRPAERLDPKAVERQLDKVRTALTRADADLAGRTWAVGDGLTLADLAVVCAVGYVHLRFPEVLEGAWPTLAAFVARVGARPSLATTAPPPA